MKEKPILFNGEMIRAILNGRKTQTRRVIKSPGNSVHIDKLLGEWSLSAPPHQYDGKGWTPGRDLPWNWSGRKPPKIGDWVWELQCDVDDHVTAPIRCPCGQPGDTLWVRETWSASKLFDDWKPSTINPDDTSIWYAATEQGHILAGDERGKTRPSIFMPRWASRITLRVKSVRVERVQEISNVDARAEGISALRDERALFAQLWDSINAKRGFGWDVNPWVWVVEFQKAE